LVLKEKEKLVLDLAVEHYLSEGKPVSSGWIVQKRPSLGSSATVRNIMGRLAELGLLEQPHTSAGRVPTDRGLRLYVNHLLSAGLAGKGGAPLPPEGLAVRGGDFDDLLRDASRILAEESDNLGFVLSPQVSKTQFHHVRFVRISGSKVMVILVTPFHIVLTEIVETLTPFTQLELDRVSQYVYQNFRGRNLAQVRDALLQELPKERATYEGLLSRLTDLLRASLKQEEGESRVFLQGTAQLLNKADLFDMVKLKALFQNFEEKANLTRLLSDLITLDRVKVLIGSEVKFADFSDCSLVLSHYGTSTQVLGSLGIIGPKRLPYERIIPLVDSVAKRLSRAIANMGSEVPR